MDVNEALAVIDAIKHQVARLEESLIGAPRPMFEIPSDVVQLKPSAHKVWGGALLRVKKVRGDGTIEGYLLRPHRGGASVAWYRAKPCEVTAVGQTAYPESRWSLEHWWHDGAPGPPDAWPADGFDLAHGVRWTDEGPVRISRSHPEGK